MHMYYVRSENNNKFFCSSVLHRWLSIVWFSDPFCMGGTRKEREGRGLVNNSTPK